MFLSFLHNILLNITFIYKIHNVITLAVTRVSLTHTQLNRKRWELTASSLQ